MIIPVGVIAGVVLAAYTADALDWSSPHHYPGKPEYGYNASWQSYFEVTDLLPNITFELPRSYAGSLSTKTAGSPNNTAFFWGFEHSDGSLTANSNEAWGIWLAGGPGYSSVAGMLLENGPIGATKDGWEPRNTSMHLLADWFWVDAPVGVGYSTVGQGSYATDEDRMARDFMGFISNLVKVFPHLKKRPLHLTGESYAGRFIPYIMKAYFELEESERLVRLVKVACGNPGLQSTDAFEQIPISRVIETYPQLIGYNTDFYDYVREQSHLCHLDLNLTYPQTGGKFSSVHIKYGQIKHRLGAGQQRRELQSHGFDAMMPSDLAARQWPPPPFNATLTGEVNKFFGCDVRDLVLTYAFNYSLPWTVLAPTFDYLAIPMTVNPLTLLIHPHHWMNHNTTRSALHAPRNAIWRVTTDTYPWGSTRGASDPSVAPMAFMDDLATNATANDVRIIWYSGNDDALTTHFSTEVAIQNTTFGGVQGFTVPPNTLWYDDTGAFAGTIRQERNWTLAIIYGAGHQTPVYNAHRTFAFMRDFVLGNSKVGLVAIGANGAVHIHTATQPKNAVIPSILPDGVVPGQDEIMTDNNKHATTWPVETRAAWSSHLSLVMATATSTPTFISSNAAITAISTSA